MTLSRPVRALLVMLMATVIVAILATTFGSAVAPTDASERKASHKASQPLPRAGEPRDRGAVDALMERYHKKSGLWPDNKWWNSANALTSLIDYMRATGDRRYRWVVANTFRQAMYARWGQFTNQWLDDTGWWALAWIRAYDLTHRARYLRMARYDTDYMWKYHDNVCGGGVWWSIARTYKDAITNELFIKAAAELHNRISGDRRYLREALTTWRWFRSSGMINGKHLVEDGVDPGSCASNRGAIWSYNQGVILGGLVDLSRAARDPKFLHQATVLADASTTSSGLNVNGVLTEPCEATGCDADNPSFKGSYVRNLGELAHATSSTAFYAYLRRQAQSAYEHDRTPFNQYGLHWAGPIGRVNTASQLSAVDLMVSVLH